MYFQNFLFDNITMLCFKDFFFDKNIRVNSMLTALTTAL